MGEFERAVRQMFEATRVCPRCGAAKLTRDVDGRFICVRCKYGYGDNGTHVPKE
jgi:ribosomal protein S27AE